MKISCFYSSYILYTYSYYKHYIFICLNLLLSIYYYFKICTYYTYIFIYSLLSQIWKKIIMYPYGITIAIAISISLLYTFYIIFLYYFKDIKEISYYFNIINTIFCFIDNYYIYIISFKVIYNYTYLINLNSIYYLLFKIKKFNFSIYWTIFVFIIFY